MTSQVNIAADAVSQGEVPPATGLLQLPQSLVLAALHRRHPAEPELTLQHGRQQAGTSHTDTSAKRGHDSQVTSPRLARHDSQRPQHESRCSHNDHKQNRATFGPCKDRTADIGECSDSHTALIRITRYAFGQTRVTIRSIRPYRATQVAHMPCRLGHKAIETHGPNTRIVAQRA